MSDLAAAIEKAQDWFAARDPASKPLLEVPCMGVALDAEDVACLAEALAICAVASQKLRSKDEVHQRAKSLVARLAANAAATRGEANNGS